LIEVNSCPALGMHGAVLQAMIPEMLEEVIQRAIPQVRKWQSTQVDLF